VNSTEKKKLDDLVKKLVDLVCVTTRRRATAQYEIGARFEVVRTNPSKFGFDRVENAQAYISKQTQLGKTSLNDAAKVATTWSREEFGEWLDKVNKRGKALTFGHFAAVANAFGAEDKNAALEKALRENLSIRKLRTLLSEGEVSARRED